MRKTSLVFIAAVCAGQLAGCSGEASGFAADVAGLSPFHLRARQADAAQGRVFISDSYKRIVILDANTNKRVGKITDGIDGATMDWVDKQGNLYVANISGANVTEYAPGGSSPMCTYSTGLNEPAGGTTDRNGNVYVADAGKPPSFLGHVDKYEQCSNTISAQYAVYSPVGVAVDRKGDVFVALQGFNFPPRSAFKEFKPGSTTGTFLDAWVNDAGGLCIDKNANLIADDWGSHTVDIIAPPYTKTATFATQPGAAWQCALNEREDRLYDADYSVGRVFVYSYPSGKLVKTYGRKNGIHSPWGVAVSPGAIF